jgi:hypothetical protein
VAGERQGPMLAADDSDIDALLGETITKVGGDAQNVIAADARLQTMLDAAMLEPKKLVDPKSLPVRFSRLKAFSLSAAHYLLWCQEGDDSGGESLALRMGSGFHAALFANRELVAYDGRRAGKDWERFEQKHRERGAVILNRKEFSIAAGMVGAIKRHKRAMELLFDGTTVEHRIDWTFSGRACRGTPDAFRADGAWNVDLKSARCTEPRWFSREALKRHYHAQLANYDDGIEAAVGTRPADAYIIAVENVAPFNVVVLRMPAETREVGAKLLRTWWERLLAAEHLNYYGGYVEADIDLVIPDYEQPPEFAVEIDDELVTA